jgi:hypothetical protein
LELVAEKEKAAAAKLLKEGKREAAMRCLKKKKFQENLIKNADQMFMNLQEMVRILPQYVLLTNAVNFVGLLEGRCHLTGEPIQFVLA